MTRLARLLPIFTLLCFFAFYALLISPSPALAITWTEQHPVRYTAELEKCNQETALNGTCYSNWSNNGLFNWMDFAIHGKAKPSMQGPPGSFYYEGGAIGKLADITQSLYDYPAASSIEYVAYVGQNLGLVPKIYAQGAGQQIFTPLLNIWKIFRNAAYTIFILIFLIIGFMIMFRRKLDPQTVIGIQQAIPRIIVALLLVTFSYAIVGFMLDLMILTTNIAAKLLEMATNINKMDILKVAQEENLFNLIGPITRSAELADIISATIQFPGLGELGEGVGDVLGWLTVWVVFGLAGFFIMFKIFFMLLGAYIGIVLNLILSPLRLLFVAIPGNKEASDWFRDLVSNIIVFPVTFIMTFLAGLFTTATTGYQTVGDTQFTWEFAAGVLGNLDWAPPMIGSKWGTVIGPLIAYGILFTIPAINKEIQKQLQIQPGPAAEAAVTELKQGAGRAPFIGSVISRVT